MKSKIKWMIVFIILILLASVYSVVDKKVSIYDAEIDSSDYLSVDLREDNEIKQTFLSKEEALDGIMVKMAAVGNMDSTILEYVLSENGEKIAAQGEVSLSKLKSGRFFRFDFDKVSGCKNKLYELQIKVKKCESDSNVTLYYTRGGQQNTKCTVDGIELDGTLVLRTVTHRFDIETFVVTLCFLIYVVLFMRWLSKLFK